MSGTVAAAAPLDDDDDDDAVSVSEDKDDEVDAKAVESADAAERGNDKWLSGSAGSAGITLDVVEAAKSCAPASCVDSASSRNGASLSASASESESASKSWNWSLSSLSLARPLALRSAASSRPDDSAAAAAATAAVAKSDASLTLAESLSRTASSCGTMPRVVAIDADDERDDRRDSAATGGGGISCSSGTFEGFCCGAIDVSCGERLGPSSAAAIAALCASISLRFSAISASRRGSGAS